jgi:hypothetical protein
VNEAWNKTQSRLRKWQKSSATGWELRRILADSEYFKVIAMCAHKRAKNPPKQVSWQDWWAFHLERLAEREAIQLLLDVWNKDIWMHINHQARAEANQNLADIAEQSRLAHEFSLALHRIISSNAQDSTFDGQSARDAGPDSLGS